jgi:hypothetical protein
MFLPQLVLHRESFLYTLTVGKPKEQKRVSICLRRAMMRTPETRQTALRCLKTPSVFGLTAETTVSGTHVRLSVSCYIYWVGYCGGNSVGLYSVGIRTESRLSFLLLSLIFVVCPRKGRENIQILSFFTN